MSQDLIVVSGASGLIGTALVSALRADGFEVKKLVRRRVQESDEIAWDPLKSLLNPDELSGAHAVVNLSGASVAKLPWTVEYRRELLKSRVRATNTLTQAIARADEAPRVLLNASAGGIYGDRPGELLTERAHPDEHTFLGKLVERWEKAAQLASPYCRVVTMRNATILAAGKGGLAPFEFLTKMYLGLTVGGKQHWPWISLHDEVRAIRHLMDSKLNGPVNMVAPEQNTMAEIMHLLAESLHRPSFFRVPKSFAGFIGEGGKELMSYDQAMVPEKLLADGFIFEDASLEKAFARIYPVAPREMH
ncbi:MAG: TIGR01777 family oxidoreductase [Microbacteriaceae bacterium]